ncbi:MAG TPA: arginine-tRNA-protein transferase [Blastocatellia bacterium]|nr:arginine-tRNA-protein transferase [Blastocatellia bacterium]
MLLDETGLINERFNSDFAPAEAMDALWAAGWRHFGHEFFRYNFGIHAGRVMRVLPLRIDLARFTFSKSQRRNLRRNAGLDVTIGQLGVTEESRSLFKRHRLRFTEGRPERLEDFVPATASASPCESFQISGREGGRLVAESYFDLGEHSASSVFAMFDPAITAAGLGIFTLLKEIEHSLDLGLEHFYLGYAYDKESFYDYKKRFRATEYFDWKGNWREFQTE